MSVKRKRLTVVQKDRVRDISSELEDKLTIYLEQEVVPSLLRLMKDTITDAVKADSI